MYALEFHVVAIFAAAAAGRINQQPTSTWNWSIHINVCGDTIRFTTNKKFTWRKQHFIETLCWTPSTV
jgi:hypothetical protein